MTDSPARPIRKRKPTMKAKEAMEVDSDYVPSASDAEEVEEIVESQSEEEEEGEIPQTKNRSKAEKNNEEALFEELTTLEGEEESEADAQEIEQAGTKASVTQEERQDTDEESNREKTPSPPKKKTKVIRDSSNVEVVIFTPSKRRQNPLRSSPTTPCGTPSATKRKRLEIEMRAASVNATSDDEECVTVEKIPSTPKAKTQVKTKRSPQMVSPKKTVLPSTPKLKKSGGSAPKIITSDGDEEENEEDEGREKVPFIQRQTVTPKNVATTPRKEPSTPKTNTVTVKKEISTPKSPTGTPKKIISKSPQKPVKSKVKSEEESESEYETKKKGESSSPRKKKAPVAWSSAEEQAIGRVYRESIASTQASRIREALMEVWESEDIPSKTGMDISNHIQKWKKVFQEASDSIASS